MGKIGIVSERTPLANAGGEALRNALVDNAALVALMRRGFTVEVRKGGRVVGKRGPGLVRRP